MIAKFSLFILPYILLQSCGQNLQEEPIAITEQTIVAEPIQLNECEIYYSNWVDNNYTSQPKGRVSKGSLINGKLMPYKGENFSYFDDESYLAGRAFTSESVKKSVLNSYDKMHTTLPERHFYLMELSNEEGGKIFPHRTHQNGLSVDFMMPMLKNNQPYYGLDTLGKNHYLLSFNENGEYSEDKEVKVDFDLIALHILELNKTAKEQGLKISKVIIKIEYKDDLFNTPNGKKLKDSGIYIVKGLTPLINHLHDDHYHIDFEKA